MTKPHQFYRFVIIIVVFALIARLSIFLIFLPNWRWQKGEIHDSWNKLAINLVESGSFGFSQGESTLWRGPLFPAFEVPLYLLFGENYLWWSIVLLLFDTFTCVLVMLLARKIWGNRASLFAGLFYAIHFAVIYYAAQIEQFTIGLPFVSLWIYLLSVWKLKPVQKWMPWIIGIVSGLLILNKSTYLPAPFVGIAYIIWIQRKRIPLIITIRQAIIILSATALVVAPWMYRNYKISQGRIIPVQLLFWSNIWVDIQWDKFDEEGGINRPDGELFDHIDKNRAKLLNKFESSPFKELSRPEKEIYEERICRKVVLEWLKQNPKKSFRRVLKNLWQFWFGSENLKKTFVFFILQIFYLGLAAAGLWILFKNKRIYKVTICIILILMLWAEHSLVYALGRFSLDLVPALGIIFGVGLNEKLSKINLH